MKLKDDDGKKQQVSTAKSKDHNLTVFERDEKFNNINEGQMAFGLNSDYKMSIDIMLVVHSILEQPNADV